MIRGILHHVSLLLIESSDRGNFLLGIYDDTYPLESFRKRVNLIGGNQHPEDQSPYGILEREIYEEFLIRTVAEKSIEESIRRTSGAGAGAPLPAAYAPIEDITKIRDALLTNYVPYGDFLITTPFLKNRPPETAAIYSVYAAMLTRELFELAQSHLEAGRAIKSEGFAKIVNREQLVRGNPLSAGPSPFILSHYLQENIPDTYGLRGIFLGMPRQRIASYEKEFRYTNVKRNQ